MPGSTVQNVIQTYSFDYDDASITEIIPATPLYYTDRIQYDYNVDKYWYGGANSSTALPISATDIPYYFSKGFLGMPTRLIINGQQCTSLGNQNIQVFNDFIVNGPVCTPPNPITIYVAGEVKLENGNTLPSNVTVVNGYNNSCGPVLLSETDPTNFCNSTTYSTLTQAYRIMPGDRASEVMDTLSKSITDVLITPNPASNYFEVAFSLKQKSKVRIDVYNSLAQLQPLTSLKGDVQMEAGLHKFKLDASMLVAGVYFIKVNTGDQVIVKKLMLQK